ncbi:MAG TPA: GTP-binding protein [Anaerohalosphaeraceae bacterium]|nr:GTP-binding protein [Anaerohalosphaeraceae bacterium]
MTTALSSAGHFLSGRNRQQMNIVVIGHVDHGKSTLIGRLLADTGSLPKGKLEAVQAYCARNAKPFEYAFLLDALKEEQTQGITIDTARCFFKSSRREYIIIDAPGHVEFLKNMISGAARAEAALLLIDAREGIRENSRRHGYLLSLLGIRQIAVAVNKMDLTDYRRDVFEAIQKDYTAFLQQVHLQPRFFIPVSARFGDNLCTRSARMCWYDGPTVLEAMGRFEKEPPGLEKPFRFPVQDVYKFTEEGDDRRIAAGRVETGTVRVGDEVIFLPSGKRSRIASIEGFNRPPQTEAYAGQSTGFTLTEQIYIPPNQILCRADQPAARTGTCLKVNLFWMGRQPMVRGKRYKLKLAAARETVWLREIYTVLDAADLSTDSSRTQIERHDTAEYLLETFRPVAFDVVSDIAQTGRFVIIDNYEIAGGGIILDALSAERDLISEHVRKRQKYWQRSRIQSQNRSDRYKQNAALVLLCGPAGIGKSEIAKTLEERLFDAGRMVYYLGLDNSLLGVDSDLQTTDERDEYIRRLGEIAHLFTDAGLILITTISHLDDYELQAIRTLNQPYPCLVVAIGPHQLAQAQPDLHIEKPADVPEVIEKIKCLLTREHYLLEYHL